ncbi:MAG TPA: tetratricopeptide repeat protein [Verrucomicrobiae bacterium]|nr:tetratricopeptide repeat protein [Verrucomicrobiae bacterium]
MFLRIAALLLPFALLGLIEAGLRLGGYGFDPHFFKALKIGDEDYLVQNDAFSYRFFPPENARNPGVLRMKAVKPPGTFRIFIFGESAAMGDPEPAYGPARYLEAQLHAKFPATKFEVVNVAFTAINSHVILPIARECARHDGDLWIIYMGNNEMVGPFGAATVFGRRAPALAYVRFITALQTTRLGQLSFALARKLHGGREKFSSWGGMQMFLQNQIAPDSPLKTSVYFNFQKNLDDIVHAGLGSGAKILLNTVAVNLRDCPPLASLANKNISPADRVEFQQLFTNGLQAEIAGDRAGAEQYYARAAQLDATVAELQYRWGECLRAQTNFSAAREHLQLACDDDASPFRTDSRLNEIIRAEPKKIPSTELVLFDAAKALAQENPDELCGDETFYEHVHFDFNGGYRLGLAWAQQVEKMLPPDATSRGDWLTRTECDQALGLSDWNRVAVWEHMAGRLLAPPFANQAGNSNRVASLEARVRASRSREDAADAVAARDNFERQLARTPDDFLLRENFALFLQSVGDAPSAIAECRRVHDLIPHDYVPYFQLGRLFAGQGQWAEAETNFRAAVKIHRALTEGWFELGNALASQQKFSEALNAYAVARDQRPQDGQTVFRMGRVYALTRQPAAALQCYREAAKSDPSDWEIHFQLGGALDEAGRADEALAEFAEAARLNPASSRTHFNYGVLLAKKGRLEEARREFTESLRLEPNYQNARDALVKVQVLLRRAGNQSTSHANP